MKSTLILVGVLASIGTAQPHSPHRHVHRHPAVYDDAVHKRDIETVWITQWQTVSMTESIGQSTTLFWYPHKDPNHSAPPSYTTPTDSFAPVSTTASSSAETDPAAHFFHSSRSVSQPPSSIPTTDTSTPVNVPPTTLSPVVISTSAASSTIPSSVTPSASPAPPSGSSPSVDYTLSGDLTFYTLGVGSCGIDDSGKDNSAYVVAVAVGLMDASWTGNPNANPNCGRSVEISYGGATAQATVVDTCEGCEGDSLDGSAALFQVFAAQSVGRLSGMQWKWLD
jgi:hypothetical protein